MAVLGRLKISPNQRLDLPDIMAFDSYAAGDWKGFLQSIVGDNPYVIAGFEIFQPNTLIGNPATSVSVVMSGSSLYWPASDEGSFFVALPGASNIPVTLITDTTNYIEMSLTLVSGAEDARALWDPGANGGAGGEFTQVVDTENYLDISITRNNTGFSDDKIPIAKVVVSGTNISSITDCRPLMFRLGSGGTSPDPLNTFNWLDDPTGYSRTDTPVTMTSSLDANTFRGADKNIKYLKQWMDAVMTRFIELSGAGAKWFQNLGTGGGGAISLSNMFLDSQAGHSPQPDRGVTVSWSKANDGKFRSENAVGYNAPIKWKVNFGQVKWALGGSFLSSSSRAYLTYTFEKSVADGENLYLRIQRDSILNSDPVVSFVNINGVTASVSSASSGSFTDIAVGDFIKKKSGTDFQYYQVVEVRINNVTPFPNGTIDGTIADATVQYIVVSTHDGPILTSDEKYRYFRTQYQSSDLVASTYGYYDTSYYWLGRRFGNMFYFRDYGDIQPGEELEILNDSETHEHGSGESGIVLDRTYNSVYSPISGYALASGSGDVLTIRRRLLDNTTGTPSNVDNSGALLTYTIASPVGLMDDGDGLWVRLSTTSGALTNGDVTSVSAVNVWEVRDPSDTPLKTYDNRNVFLVARKFTVGAVECLFFCDGTMMSLDGEYINNHLSVQGDIFANSDLYLRTKTQWSIPFIGTSLGRVDENNAQFFWNNTAGPSGVGQFGVRNIRISENTTSETDVIDQDVAQDVDLFPSLGTHTLKIGSAASTIHVPGNLVVDGYSVATHATILQIDDKLLTLGVGSLSNGGYGAGIEVADDTKVGTTVDSFIGQLYVDVDLTTSHVYTLGDIFAVDSNVACGGITAGQMARAYTIVASVASAGDAEIISPTKIRIMVDGVAATSTQTVTLAPPTTNIRLYKSPSSFRIGGSDGTYTSITSWIFRVKGISTAPSITPFSGYGIVPTAHSSNMQAMRIPFVNDDNVGPSGADTTLNFSNNLTWDNNTNTFSVGGTFSLSGDLLPSIDDFYNIGSLALQWHALYIGALPGSGIIAGNDTNLYRYAANHWKTDDNFEVVGNAIFDYVAQFAELSGPPTPPSIGKVSVWADSTGLLYQRTSDGDVNIVVTVDGNVYNEEVDVVAVPSGNNQMAPIPTPPQLIIIPKDTNHVVGQLIIATTSNGSPTVTVSRNGHGMVNGDLVTVSCSLAIGGIPALNLSVTNVAIFGVTANSFQYTATASATSNDSGYLDMVTSIFQRDYMVGSNELEVYLNGALLRSGIDYTEVGAPGSISSSIQILIDIVLDDVIKYRIDSNGGQYIINQNGVASLQSAYNIGSTINVSVGNPVTITGTSGKLLHVAGDIQCDGVVDPTGMTFIPQSSNPLPLNKAGIWANAAGELMQQVGDGVTSPVNVSSAISGIVDVVDGSASLLVSGGSISKGDPVYGNATGGATRVNVSTEAQAMATVGLANDNISSGNYGKIVIAGLIKDVTMTFSLGDVLYISKTGTLTNTKPSIGVDGFLAGDFVVKVGVVTKNKDDALKKDIVVNVQVIGQL